MTCPPKQPVPGSCPLSTNPVSNRLISFSAKYSLEGDYSASAVFSDPNCEDDPQCFQLCHPLTISLPTVLEDKDTSVGLGQVSIDACYGQNPLWVNGLMDSFSPSLEEFTTSVNVSSFFEYLKTKPIETQKFSEYLLSDVFATIFPYYAGVPNSLLNIVSYKNRRIMGPVSGGDTMAELKALAQVGEAHMFVQVGGKLTIEIWKNHLSQTEITIPPELIISVEKGSYQKPPTNIIRAKGAQLLGQSCSPKNISNSNSFGMPGNTKKCVISGQETPTIELTFNNLNGDQEDVRTAQLAGTNMLEAGNRSNISSGSFTSKFRKQNLQWFGPVPTIVDINLTNISRSNRDEALFGFKPTSVGQNVKSIKKVDKMLSRILSKGFPVPNSAFGRGPYGSETFTKSSQEDVSEAYGEIEAYIFKNEQYPCGIAVEDISNKYASDLETLFSLGVRRFQEIELSQNTYNLTLPYIPCLRLNMVVEFDTPDTCCPVKRVKGVISEIDIDTSIDENGAAETTMKIVVQDFTCIGNTLYRSGNLIRNYCTDTAWPELNGWQTSALNLQQGSGFDTNVMWLWNVGGFQTSIFYHHIHQVDPTNQAQLSYTLSYNYETTFGNFNTATGFGSLSGSGFFSTTYTPQTPLQTFFWLSQAPFGFQHYLRITNLRLVKTILA
jgi:hypothetical protein